MATYRNRGDKNFNEKWGLTTSDFEFIVECEDHTDEILEKMNSAIIRALYRIGLQCVSFAQKLCPVSTGRLRNSITFEIDENDNSVFIGTNVEYAAYVELGTGKYYSGGRKSSWVYKDAEGNRHMTNGQKAKPYLKPAATNHAKTYKNILEDEMKNG